MLVHVSSQTSTSFSYILTKKLLVSGEYWTQKAHGNSDNRGKELRRDGFTLAEERYGASNLIFILSDR